MSFRLRRGTDTERQSVVFAEGELVYTTDTKELYVGDGTTLGGIRITGAVAESPIALTQDLDMNGFDIVGSGDIDINGQIIANAFYGNGSGLTNLPVLDVNNGASYQISIMGADSSIIVNSDTSEVSGEFFGNLRGAVYDTSNNIMIDNVLRTMYGTLTGEFNGTSSGIFVGGDSSVMINGANSTFYGNFSGDASNLTNFPPDIGVTEGSNYRINIVGADSSVLVDSESSRVIGEVETPRVTTEELSQVTPGRVVITNFLREEPGPTVDPDAELSKFNHGVKLDGVDQVYWVSSFTENQYIILPRPNNTPDFGKFLKIWSNGKVMINGATGISGFEDLAVEPDSQLDIYGVMKLSPQSSVPTQPVEGMIAVADRVNWDPASVGSGGSYPVYYDGTSWYKMI